VKYALGIDVLLILDYIEAIYNKDIIKNIFANRLYYVKVSLSNEMPFSPRYF
jgi:hypothetical protein